MILKTTYLAPFLLMLLASLSAQAVGNPPIERASTQTTVAVLELYTSEGCYNCPAAERYLKDMNKDLGDKHEFIPLAFHVDYWDYIGWEDPFADPSHGLRQREIAQRNRLNSLYTPQFVLYGRDFPAYNNIPEAIGVINELKPRADIQVAVSLKDAQQLSTRIAIQARDERAKWYSKIYIAVAENNLSSKITDGENEGLHLQHDHVVRQFLGPFSLEGKKQLELNQAIRLDKQWKLNDLSLVVFAQDSEDGTTHQALQVPLTALAEQRPTTH